MPVEAEERELSFIEFRQVASKFDFRLADLTWYLDKDVQQKKPPRTSLLVCDNTRGILLFPTTSGIGWVKCVDVLSNRPAEDTVRKVHIGQNNEPISALALSRDCELLAVASGTKALFYHTASVLGTAADVEPLQVVDLTHNIVSILARNESFIVLTEAGKLSELNFKSLERENILIDTDVACVGANGAGEILAVGASNNVVELQISNDTSKKIPPPDGLEQATVDSIMPLSPTSALVCFSSEEGGHVFVAGCRGEEYDYHSIFDTSSGRGSERKDQHYILVLSNWGSNLDSLIVIANYSSPNVLVAGRHRPDEAYGSFFFDADDCLAQLPMSRFHKSEDTCAVGVALDFTNAESIPSADPDEPPLPPAPIYWVLNSDGVVCGFRIVKTNSRERYHEMRPMKVEIDVGAAREILTQTPLSKGLDVQLQISEHVPTTFPREENALPPIKPAMEGQSKEEPLSLDPIDQILTSEFLRMHCDFDCDLAGIRAGLDKICSMAHILPLKSDADGLTERVSTLLSQSKGVFQSLARMDGIIREVAASLISADQIVREALALSAHLKLVGIGKDANPDQTPIGHTLSDIEAGIAKIVEFIEFPREQRENDQTATLLDKMTLTMDRLDLAADSLRQRLEELDPTLAEAEFKAMAATATPTSSPRRIKAVPISEVQQKQERARALSELLVQRKESQYTSHFVVEGLSAKAAPRSASAATLRPPALSASLSTATLALEKPKAGTGWKNADMPSSSLTFQVPAESPKASFSFKISASPAEPSRTPLAEKQKATSSFGASVNSDDSLSAASISSEPSIASRLGKLHLVVADTTADAAESTRVVQEAEKPVATKDSAESRTLSDTIGAATHTEHGSVVANAPEDKEHAAVEQTERNAIASFQSQGDITESPSNSSKEPEDTPADLFAGMSVCQEEAAAPIDSEHFPMVKTTVDGAPALMPPKTPAEPTSGFSFGLTKIPPFGQSAQQDVFSNFGSDDSPFVSPMATPSKSSVGATEPIHSGFGSSMQPTFGAQPQLGASVKFGVPSQLGTSGFGTPSQLGSAFGAGFGQPLSAPALTVPGASSSTGFAQFAHQGFQVQVQSPSQQQKQTVASPFGALAQNPTNIFGGTSTQVPPKKDLPPSFTSFRG